MKGPRSQRPCGPAPRLESPLLWGTPTDLVTRPPCRESYCPGEGFAPGGQCTHSPSALPARVGRRCLLGPWGPPGPKRGGRLHQPSCHFNSSGKGDGPREGRGKCPLEGGPGNCFQVTRLGFLRVAIWNRAWKATKYHSDDESRPPSRNMNIYHLLLRLRVDLEDRSNRSSTR